MFVGGLDPSVRQKDLFNFFQYFGNITKVKIVGESKGRSRGYGFVHFESKDVLYEVCNMTGLELNGREIDCRIANSELQNRPKEETEDPNKIKKIFISEVPLFIKKSELYFHFSNFGVIKDVLLIVRPNKDNSFAYVKFFKHEDAKNAVESLIEIRPGILLKAVLALPKDSEKLKELRKNFKKKAYHIDYYDEDIQHEEEIYFKKVSFLLNFNSILFLGSRRIK